MKQNNILKLLLVLASFLFITSCGDVEFADVSSGWNSGLTEVLSTTSAFANGEADAVVRLRVYTTTGAPRVGLQLRSFDFANNIKFVRCDPSDANGFVNCYFRSNVVGTRQTEIFDEFGRVNVNVTFSAMSGVRFAAKTGPSSRLRQTEFGYTVTTEVKNIQGFRSTAGGYTVKTQTVYD